MTARARASACAWALAATFSLVAIDGRAADADAIALARAAYDRGALAYDGGKYALAAREFTTADELSPNPVALKFALQAALKIDDPVLGMRLVERAQREGADLGVVARDAKEKFARRVGRITLTCGDAPCRARIDGEPANATTWVTAGPHAIEWERSGMNVHSAPRTSINVAAGETIEVTPPATSADAGAVSNVVTPPKDGTEPQEKSSVDEGWSPAWFWVGIGLTTIGFGASIASGLDTLHQHQLFAAHPTTDEQHAGQNAQLRTNVFFGITAALAVTTAGIGIFAVKWNTAQKASAYLDLHTRGLGIAVTLHQ